MKNIDFLPDMYRQRDALRRARVWWGAVVVIFGVAIGSAASAQYLLKRSIQRDLAAIQPQHLAAQARVQELTQLQAQIAASSRSARLVTWLEHPWPRSQILAGIVQAVPENLQITEIHIIEETLERKTPQAAGPRRRGAKREEEQGPKLSGAEADLAQLREEAAARQTAVQVRGTTGDVAALHAYVSEISESSLFAHVQLASIETTTDEKQRSTTTFSLRIIVKPSYGKSDEAANVEQPTAQTIPTIGPAGQLAQGGGNQP